MAALSLPMYQTQNRSSLNQSYTKRHLSPLPPIHYSPSRINCFSGEDGFGLGRSLPQFKELKNAACGILAVFAITTASPTFAAPQRLPPLSTEPNRCERAFVGNTIGQANGVYDKAVDLRKTLRFIFCSSFLSQSLFFLFSLRCAKMSKGPGLFLDIGKKAKDLLTRDYNSDQKFTVSTYSDTGVALTSTAVKRGGLSTGDVAGQYKYRNTLVDVKLDTESNILTTLTFTEILPSTKTIASFKLPDYNSGKLEVQYFHDHATFTAGAALKQSPVFDVSATIGTPTIAFGAEAGYEASSGSFTKYTAGISVNKPDSCASIIFGDKGDSIKASYVHNLDLLKKGAAVGEITRRFSTNENTFTVGGSYAVDNLTVVKAKLNNHGKLGALLQHEIIPKSLLTISGEFETKALEKTPRFGLALALKP